MKRIIFPLLLFCWSPMTFTQPGEEQIDQLTNKFLSTDWPTVLSAKEQFENLESVGIPYLIAILNDCVVRKLQNTGDLIFPGAEKFYGHGQIIDYDIDDICVRTGWLLEDLTFQNFGFSGIHLPDGELTDFIKFNFPEYYNNSENRRQLNNMTANQKRKLIKAFSISKARNWWEGASDDWKRLDALVEALNSNDEKRQVKALFYLRNGKTRCKDLTNATYKSRMENTVSKLARVDLNRVSENAKLILLDKELDWLSLKPVD